MTDKTAPLPDDDVDDDLVDRFGISEAVALLRPVVEQIQTLADQHTVEVCFAARWRTLVENQQLRQHADEPSAICHTLAECPCRVGSAEPIDPPGGDHCPKCPAALRGGELSSIEYFYRYATDPAVRDLTHLALGFELDAASFDVIPSTLTYLIKLLNHAIVEVELND